MSIVVNQELPENIERLAAQKNIYSRAKNIIGLQMILSIPVAMAAAVTTIIKPELNGYIAIWGILMVVFDLFMFTPWVKQLQDNAARIQELFDTSVFHLDWNEISVGNRPDPELVAEHANKHGLEDNNVINLRAWYPLAVNQVPNILGILICQRSNIWWDSRMRRKYAFTVRFILISIALGLVVYGLHERKDMFEFLVYVAAPLLSTYVFGYRQMYDHSQAADRLDKLKGLSEKIWSDALHGKDVDTLKAESRTLQDQIFEHRRNNPPVFDFLFNFFRDNNEALMNRGADSLVSEALQQNTN